MDAKPQAVRHLTGLHGKVFCLLSSTKPLIDKFKRMQTLSGVAPRDGSPCFPLGSIFAVISGRYDDVVFVKSARHSGLSRRIPGHHWPGALSSHVCRNLSIIYGQPRTASV